MKCKHPVNNIEWIGWYCYQTSHTPVFKCHLCGIIGRQTFESNVNYMFWDDSNVSQFTMAQQFIKQFPSGII